LAVTDQDKVGNFQAALLGKIQSALTITGRTRNTVQTAGSKPPITAPTPPSNASSISWLQLDRAAPQ